MNKNSADIVIVGGGPAGLTAALYSARAGMDTLLLEKGQPGGQLWLSERIENYPGFPEGIGSFDLAENMKKQALNFGALILSREVSKIKEKDENFIIGSSSEEEFMARALIICTGVKMKSPGIPGEEELKGKGVSYCAVCDGPLFKGKRVAVIGGGDTACEEANYLSRFAGEVLLIHRRPRLRALKSIALKTERNPGIKLMLSEEVEAIKGSGKVEEIKLKSGKNIRVDGLFIFIGYEGTAGWLKNFIKTESGFIITDPDLKTSREGVFGAGDCREGAFRQVVSACGEGAAAAQAAVKYVEKLKGESYDW